MLGQNLKMGIVVFPLSLAPICHDISFQTSGGLKRAPISKEVAEFVQHLFAYRVDVANERIYRVFSQPNNTAQVFIKEVLTYRFQPTENIKKGE